MAIPSFLVPAENGNAAALVGKEDGHRRDRSGTRAIALAMQRGQRRVAWCTAGIVALALGCGAHGEDDAASAASTAAVTVDQHLAAAIVHADGSAVPWAWLEITGADGNPVAQGNSPKGTFALALPSGSYQLHAFDGSLALPVRSLDLTIDRDVQLVEGGASTNLHLDVRYAGSTPIPWAWVNVVDARGTSVWSGNAPRGQFDLTVGSGSYTVGAWAGSTALGTQTVTFAASTEDHALSFVEAGGPGDDFVRPSGTGLQLNGLPYVFRGVDLYNANSKNTCGGDVVDGTVLDTALQQIGTGANAMRAWFFQDMAQTNGVRDWSNFDHTLALAKSYGIRVVATLENEWSACSSPGEKDEAWFASGYRTPQGTQLVAYRDWVKEFTARYQDEPTILAIQLINEAADANNGGADCPADASTVLQAWATDMIGAVKNEVGDKRHMLSVGTIGGSSQSCGTQGDQWKALHALWGVDICEYHDYEGTAALPSILAQHIRECQALGKPIFAGEMGVDDSDANRTADASGKLAAQYGAGTSGILFWKWAIDGQRASDGDASYNLVPGDPLLPVLSSY
jgi:hypothetical protein